MKSPHPLVIVTSVSAPSTRSPQRDFTGPLPTTTICSGGLERPSHENSYQADRPKHFFNLQTIAAGNDRLQKLCLAHATPTHIPRTNNLSQAPATIPKPHLASPPNASSPRHTTGIDARPTSSTASTTTTRYQLLTTEPASQRNLHHQPSRMHCEHRLHE